MGRVGKWDGVRPASKSSIRIDFVYKGVRCFEFLKFAPTPANLKKAERHRVTILDAISRDTFDYAITFPESKKRFMFAASPSAGLLLSTYLEKWLENQKAHLKASTYDDYRKIVMNTLIPAFGKHMITDLKRGHIRDWCATQKASNKRLANVQSVLRAALDDRKDDDDTYVNPLTGWKYEKNELKVVTDEDADVDVFDKAEQAFLLKACREEQHRNLFQFAFWTGMRTSELVPLTWDDIDFEAGTARVNKAKTEASDVVEGVKTKKSYRLVKILPMALAALNAQKKFSRLAGQEVFLNPRTGKPWQGDQAIRHAWTHAVKDAGLRYRNPYQTRHTYASMMLTAGENLGWLASQMGHVDLNMLSRRYAKWIASATPEAGNKADELFGNPT